jgi:predicted alpha/beta hydrolase family esterase
MAFAAETVLSRENAMVDVLLVQGASKGAHAYDAKLAASLASQLGATYKVHFPRMPREEEPEYAAWAQALSNELAGLTTARLVLVGHSLGASFLLRYLALNDVAPELLGVFLVAAPFIGEGGWRGTDFSLPATSERLNHLRLSFFQGDADETVPAEHLALYEEVFPQALVRRLAGRDHQLNDNLAEIAAEIRGLGPAA